MSSQESSTAEFDPHAGTYHERLGISLDADASTIRTAGKRAFNEYHPDNTSGDTRDLYDRVKQARDTLQDDLSRRSYRVFCEQVGGAAGTRLYEKWVMGGRSQSPEAWIEANYDSDSNSGDSSNDSDNDSNTSSSDSSSGTAGERSRPSPTPRTPSPSSFKPTPSDTESESESNSNPTGDSSYHFEAGLSEDELGYVLRNLETPVIIDGDGSVEFDERRKSLMIKSVFDYDIRIDLFAGDLAGHDVSRITPNLRRLLGSVYVSLDQSEDVLVFSHERATGTQSVSVSLTQKTSIGGSSEDPSESNNDQLPEITRLDTHPIGDPIVSTETELERLIDQIGDLQLIESSYRQTSVWHDTVGESIEITTPSKSFSISLFDGQPCIENQDRRISTRNIDFNYDPILQRVLVTTGGGSVYFALNSEIPKEQRVYECAEQESDSSTSQSLFGRMVGYIKSMSS